MGHADTRRLADANRGRPCRAAIPLGTTRRGALCHRMRPGSSPVNPGCSLRSLGGLLELSDDLVQQRDDLRKGSAVVQGIVKGAEEVAEQTASLLGCDRQVDRVG